MVWSILVVVVLGIIVALLAVYFVKHRKQPPLEPDYRNYFWMGVVFLTGHFAYSFFRGWESTSALFILGIVFLVMGLAHKDRWGKKRKRLTRKQIREQGLAVLAGVIVLALGLIMLILMG